MSKEISATIAHSKDSVHVWHILQNQIGGSVRPRYYSLCKEIRSLTQGEMSVSEYHGKLLQLWSEEEALKDSHPCDLGMASKLSRCFEKKLIEMKLMQFLKRLDSTKVHAF